MSMVHAVPQVGKHMFSQVTQTEVARVRHLLALFKVSSKLLLLVLESLEASRIRAVKSNFGGVFLFGATMVFLAFCNSQHFV